MSNTVIIIPSRLKAERLPNKPLKLIRNKEMILHVYDLAVKSKVGEVLLVTPDNEIAELKKKNGGNSIDISFFIKNKKMMPVIAKQINAITE